MRRNIFGDFWRVMIQNKNFVLNLRNGNIHHFTCEWVDNINDIQRLTQKMVINLLTNRKSFYKLASCCKDKLKL